MEESFHPTWELTKGMKYTFYYKKHVHTKNDAEIRQKVRNIGRLSFK